nr:MAG TPA: hypothetical protein [Caudoviricetes sp.]
MRGRNSTKQNKRSQRETKLSGLFFLREHITSSRAKRFDPLRSN